MAAHDVFRAPWTMELLGWCVFQEALEALQALGDK